MATPSNRILLVLPSLGRGGGERVMLQLAGSFLAAGREVHVAALLGRGPLRSHIPDGANLHELVDVDADGGATGLALARAAFPRLAALLQATRPHAVLSTMTGTNLLTAFVHKRVPCGARLFLREASSLVNARSAVKRLAMRWLYRRADGLIAVSSGVARDLRGLGLAEDRIHVIHNPVDRERLRRLADTGAVVPGLGVAPYVIALGRLTEAKDYPTLLRAYAASKLRRSHRLVIIGEGEQRPSLEKLTRELGIADCVSLPGALDNPYRMLADASLLILSSRWEGYPNVLLEALAFNVPVVATDCRHGPRELLEDGRFGQLVPVSDPAALARAMDAECGHRSGDIEGVIAKHEPRLVAARYLDVLDGKS